jgi:hypothetical protein
VGRQAYDQTAAIVSVDAMFPDLDGLARHIEWYQTKSY